MAAMLADAYGFINRGQCTTHWRSLCLLPRIDEPTSPDANGGSSRKDFDRYCMTVLADLDRATSIPSAIFSLILLY